MAAQCRSPRCTAERKGFRRELDSWRHRLIHCVGFESILEGLYGPGLRKDLSLFDDCEPQELVDWCVDDKCSLCNLRKDNNDYTPSGGSAQSTPTGELISQGQFNTEKTECQAENYLNALFQKKDLPQNCDPNIPLVAQELMKKMIRQFAIEYISKSRKMYHDSNGTIADGPLGRNGIQKDHTDSLLFDEQDGPLDLTVTRIQEQTFQDGVLDLSIKRNGCAFDENSKTRNAKNGVLKGYFLRKMKKSTRLHKENTVLFKVLASWCLYHQQQLIDMLKFLKEEQESCSQMCHNNAQSRSVEQVSQSQDSSLATYHKCTNPKSTKSIKMDKKIDQVNLPHLSVCLKDLRFIWPNLNLGTVKLNRNKKDNVNLSDQLLHCINTRSKKKSVSYDCFRSHHSTRQRLFFSSALSKLRLQRAVSELKGSTVKNGYTRPRNRLEMTSKCCQKNPDQSDGKSTTVIKNVTFKDLSCANENQNGVKPTRKYRKKSSVSSATSGVNLRKLIKRFLKSETNGFAGLLNQKEKCSGKNGQTGLYRNNEKMSIFNSSLSGCQTIDFARELNNLTDTFPTEKKYFVRNSPATIDDGKAVSVGEHARDVLRLKDYRSTETECDIQEKITDLPRNTLKRTSKNVNCIKKCQFCLPAYFKCSAPQRIVNKQRTNKRRINLDGCFESTIPPKRYARNIIGICKLCDMSHGLPSCQNNLFCRCTIQKNSGILKNFKAEGVTFKNTTEKIKNVHLKVVVERLADSKLSATSTINCKGVCKLKNTNLCNREIEAGVLNVPQKRPNNVEQSQTTRLISKMLAKANYAGVKETHKSVTNVSTPTTSSNNSYFSPIKLMFVSKVENEGGVKYTLSSEYPPLNKPGDAKLSNCVIKKCDNRKKKAPPSAPENKASAQISPAKLLFSADQSHCERKTSSRKTSASQIESQHTRCSQKTCTKLESDFAFFPNQTAKSKKRRSKLGKSRIAETYVVQNKGSGTQLRIKKVKRILRSPERILQKRESKTPRFQRISERLKRRRLSNVSGMCRTNSCISHQGGKTLLLPFQEAFAKYTERESDTAKNDQGQKTVTKQKWGSLLIRKQLRCSNYETRSKKPLSPSFSSLPSSTFSGRSALCNESKKLYLHKCRIYRRKLRCYKQQCKIPLVDTKCTSNKAENCTENIRLQPSTVLKWWSASTTKESLLNDLETKYEQVANTWLRKNNREKDSEAQSLSTLKVCSSEKRSPVQMLFQKKCDLGDLAAWFMQTTETQSLSIGRKANAQSPLQKNNRKGRITKANEPSINSCSTKKHLKNCGLPTQSETFPKLLNDSKISKRNRKAVQNVNNLNNMTDQNNEVCVKFACLEKHVDVPKAYAGKASTSIRVSAKGIAQSVNIDESSENCQGSATIPSSIINIGSLGSSKKQNRLLKNKCKPKPEVLNMGSSSKQNIQDCKVYLTKLDVETKMSCAYRNSPSQNTVAGNKSNFKLGWRLERGFTRKNKSVSRSSNILSRMENSTSKKSKFGMCLRKSKEPGASYNSKSLILERQKQLSKMTLFVETRAMRSKPPIPNTGKIPNDCQKFHLGSVKPVGIPAIRGLSSRGGTYSLTPIRIPLQ